MYEKLNDEDFYLSMKKILDDLPNSKNWQTKIDNYKYSKENFGEQKFNLIKYLRKTKVISSFFKKKINLDMDFSKVKKWIF